MNFTLLIYISPIQINLDTVPYSFIPYIIVITNF